ncbi:hypothetical protein V1L54_01265 [Streptomyces sp. TRM 70361]|uniref:hypothetical protein n=1 Tax=Streptomyces sp. TRM 70361 TaxID=3116553 RepID=UPI002E7C3C70|nr:hypothetical protein [Streptomyces sp. TRM 70361]MEE1938058.1 hypothetical protein [Streptomyces sp. TRM 70361]
MSGGQPQPRRLVFADPGEAAELAALLERLLRWERNAVVRLRARRPHQEEGVLGLFARPARFEVLAVRTARLVAPEGTGGSAAGPVGPVELDTTVSAGELLEGVAEKDASVSVPAAVTGPPWAGLLPPLGGWRPVGVLPYESVRAAADSVVAEFRRRSEALPPGERTREALDALAEEIWSRPLGGGTGLPLRAVHAARSLGMLRPLGPAPAAGPQGPPPPGRPGGAGPEAAVLAAGTWLRLRTPYGSVAVRRGGGTGLGVIPVRGG